MLDTNSEHCPDITGAEQYLITNIFEKFGSINVNVRELIYEAHARGIINVGQMNFWMEFSEMGENGKTNTCYGNLLNMFYRESYIIVMVMASMGIAKFYHPRESEIDSGDLSDEFTTWWVDFLDSALLDYHEHGREVGSVHREPTPESLIHYDMGLPIQKLYAENMKQYEEEFWADRH